ncbi:hypothetical protein [Bradyrhizobium sp. Ec3.3]|uniref:hypothetical protein n=1 Tax=Bradyrhizobium sp. Ec3.3 TaxID=189753 RepID=UPI000483E713|nr:hypothetical protein [Bradyrhizobium sp. Ec3.3]
MAGLKSFLQGVAPILGVSPAALYERQRALVNIGVLEPTTGRGPGSGVPFTAENFAAVLISLLAAESLSKVDECVADLCRAMPVPSKQYKSWWIESGKPTFRSDVGLLLAGQMPIWTFDHIFIGDSFYEIRVTRPWRGQLVSSAGEILDYYPTAIDETMVSRSISVTAAIEREMFSKLITFTKGALSQIEAEEDDS